MAETGYDDAKTRLLITTNWIRTAAFLVQTLLATIIVTRALARLRVDGHEESMLSSKAASAFDGDSYVRTGSTLVRGAAASRRSA